MSIARKSALDASAQAATVLLSMVAGIFVSRKLGDEGRGAYILATTVANLLLVELGSFGMRISCQIHAAKEPARTNEIHTFGVLFSLGVGVAIGGALLLFAPFVQSTLLRGISNESLLIIAVTFPFALYHAAWRGLMNGLGAIPSRAGFDFGYGFAHSAAIIVLLLALTGRPVMTLVAVYYALVVLAVFVMLVLLRRKAALWARPRWELVRRVLGYGKWIYAGNLASHLRQVVDHLLVNFGGGAAALGVYNQAASLANRSMMLSEALATSSYQPITAGESKEAGRLVAAGFRQLLLISVALTALGWIAAPLIPLIYGSDFARSVWPFRVLVPAVCLLGCSRIVAIYYSGHLVRPDINAAVNWFTVVLQVAACWMLARVFGPLIGITYGTALTYLVTAGIFVGMFLARKETPRAGELFRIRREDFERWRRIIKGNHGKENSNHGGHGDTENSRRE